jgi:hypothetical protein
MIASSIMNQFGSKQKRLENRLLALLCFCFFIAGIPFCARVSHGFRKLYFLQNRI